MSTVSIGDLHLRTGEWVRRAAAGISVVVTDRGRPVASLVPYEPPPPGRGFRSRRLLPEFAAMPFCEGDVTWYVSEDRDRG